MELRVLRYFLVVAREESISRAAELLHITQPTLSRQIMELEDELGKKLFLRGGRRMTLTEDGVFLRGRAQEIVSLADSTAEEFRSTEEDVSGEIRIGGGESPGMRLIAAAATELVAAHPHVSCQFFSGNAADVMERLDKGLVDFGVFVEPADLSRYEYVRLPTAERWGVLMRSDSPLAARASLRPEDVTALPLICSRQALVANEISGWMGQSFDRLNVIATYNLLYNASLLVEEGMGYALCLEGIIRSDNGGPLCFRPLEPGLEVGLALAWKKYQVFSRAAEKFLDILQENVRRRKASVR
ncbi:LysR family transcriptional regulator [uncultured Mailhella sp.]|uniref:LysR family transcriptional regulator n=1 Tax=uncultured Mailhella sp. TaxID=1981031 RepID=UPI0025E0E8CB|nr:LysR family transcriptional regulator [uncultured Mailhella sp.]